VADRADIDVRLGALELLLGHVTVFSFFRGDAAWDRGSPRSARPTVGGAHNRTRTDDLFLTKEVLCQLSYVGRELAREIS
jgi:hypothetical protein